MKRLIISLSIYVILGIFNFYFRHVIPIETTNEILLASYYLSILLCTGVLCFLLIQKITTLNKSIERLAAFSLIVLFLHNFIGVALMLIFPFGGNYIDDKVIYSDSDNIKHKIIEQHLDFGVFGSKARTVEVYELGLGFRYVVELEK